MSETYTGVQFPWGMKYKALIIYQVEDEISGILVKVEKSIDMDQAQVRAPGIFFVWGSRNIFLPRNRVLSITQKVDDDD